MFVDGEPIKRAALSWMVSSFLSVVGAAPIQVPKWLPLISDCWVSESSRGLCFERRGPACSPDLHSRPAVRGLLLPLPAARGMSDFALNLDFSAGASQKQAHPNLKHQHFLKRRAYLERKGYLHKKQGASVQVARRGSPPSGWTAGSRACQPARAPPSGFCANGTGIAGTAAKAPQKGIRVLQTICRDLQQRKPPSSSSSSSASSSSSHPSRPPSAHAKTERALLLSECQSGLPPMADHAKRAPVPANATSSSVKPYKCVALDCEMVGTGQGGKRSELARCSVIGYDGDLVYDKYILPPNPITDYRTRWSGIRRQHMRNATPFKLAQKEILKVLCGKIVIGHAVHNDFKALNYFHPLSMTRDTSKIPLLNRKAGFPEKESVSLKRLTKQLLHRDIQVGKQGHSSVEDARATMELYKLVEAQWEREAADQPGQK